LFIRSGRLLILMPRIAGLVISARPPAQSNCPVLRPAASLFAVAAAAAAAAAAKYRNGSVAHLHHHSYRFCLATRIVWPLYIPHCFSSVPFLPPPIMLLATTFFKTIFFKKMILLVC
jgi:hypothetical protein